ncbi:hypothetical protein BZL54_04635 [Burkholderia ubonensis subsp. mesacidophila]|uniref:Uncharacterized protein n=1 Tax=Burkholderia ubonensis subsp. mesacidophila TaxID=265293 RepID=A0A2A4FM78_9BURK|nr:hypothetical protein BZL54_04635 [Burkholderia ubonensis subsp. mesacidophila]
MCRHEATPGSTPDAGRRQAYRARVVGLPGPVFGVRERNAARNAGVPGKADRDESGIRIGKYLPA